MKRFIISALIAVSTLTACGDDGLTKREKACLEATGGAQECLREFHQPVQTTVIRETSPRTGHNDYDDYYDEPDYGFNDNGYDTGDMLLATMGGALLGGYAMKKYSDGRYYITDRSGKQISSSEYARRLNQSNNDKLKNSFKKKHPAPKRKVVKKPTPAKNITPEQKAKNDALKAKLKQKQSQKELKKKLMDKHGDKLDKINKAKMEKAAARKKAKRDAKEKRRREKAERKREEAKKAAAKRAAKKHKKKRKSKH